MNCKIAFIFCFFALCSFNLIKCTDLDKLKSAASGRLFDLGGIFGGRTPYYGYSSRPTYGGGSYGGGSYGGGSYGGSGYYPSTGGYYPQTGGGYYPQTGGGYYPQTAGGYYPQTGSGYYPGTTSGWYPSTGGTNVLGGTGGYGGYGGNGGLQSYYGYKDNNYYGNRNIGYGYYPGTNRFGWLSQPEQVSGYRGYN